MKRHPTPNNYWRRRNKQSAHAEDLDNPEKLIFVAHRSILRPPFQTSGVIGCPLRPT